MKRCLCVWMVSTLLACGGPNVEAPAPAASPSPPTGSTAPVQAAPAVDANTAAAPAANANDLTAQEPNKPPPPPPVDIGQVHANAESLASFHQGEALLASDPNAARLLFEKAASQDSNFYGAAYNAGAIAARAGDYEGAQRNFDLALKMNPDFGPAAAGLATLYQRAPGGATRAEQLLRNQLARQDNPAARAALAELLVRTNRLDEAQREAIAVLHLDERNAVAQLALGMVFRRQHKYELSELALNQAIEVDPDQGEAYNELGLVFLTQKNKAKAVKAFESAAKASPHVASIQNNLGVLQTEVGAFKAAVDSLRIATSLEPARSEYQLNLGNALRGDQQYSEAERSYKQALDAGNKGALFNLGVLYLDNEMPGKDPMTRYQECMQYLSKYQQLVPNDPDTPRVSEYLQTAQKAIEAEAKRAQREKQRKEKDAAEAAKKATDPKSAAKPTGGMQPVPAAPPGSPGSPPAPAVVAPPPAKPAAEVRSPAEPEEEQVAPPQQGKKHKGKKAHKKTKGKARHGSNQ